MNIPVPLRKARVLATKCWPYYATALWQLQFYPTKLPAGSVMGIDAKWRVGYDEEWLEKLQPAQLAIALAHEINHNLRKHYERVGERQPMIWNLAADCEINDEFTSEERQKMATDYPLVYPHNFNFPQGLHAEKYYDMLMKDAKHITVKVDCGHGAHGQGQEGDGKAGSGKEPLDAAGNPLPGLSEAEGDLIRHEVAAGILAGKGHRDAPLWVKQTLDPKVNWRKLLSRMIRAAGQTVAGCVDYTYTRPSRRQWKPIVLPKMIAKQATLGIVMDTSGSMSLLLETAFAEVKGIAKAGNMAAQVYFVDDDLAGTGKAGDSQLAKRVAGGGGTDMRVGIDYALKQRPRPDVIVVLTDGYTPWPAVAPPVPLIVGIVGSPPSAFDPTNHLSQGLAPSWARVVHIDI